MPVKKAEQQLNYCIEVILQRYTTIYKIEVVVNIVLSILSLACTGRNVYICTCDHIVRAWSTGQTLLAFIDINVYS